MREIERGAQRGLLWYSEIMNVLYGGDRDGGMMDNLAGLAPREPLDCDYPDEIQDQQPVAPSAAGAGSPLAAPRRPA